MNGLVNYSSDSESEEASPPQVAPPPVKPPVSKANPDVAPSTVSTTISEDDKLPSEKHAQSENRSPFLELEEDKVETTTNSWREHYDDMSDGGDGDDTTSYDSDQSVKSVDQSQDSATIDQSTDTITPSAENSSSKNSSNKKRRKIPTKYKNAKKFAEFIYKHRHYNLDDILPPEPTISNQESDITEHIQNLMNIKHNTGLSLIGSIENRKSFKNPSIYQQLIKSHGINESGSNFPDKYEMNMNEWDDLKTCYYDSLREEQVKHNEELEKKKNRMNARKEAALRKGMKSKFDQK